MPKAVNHSGMTTSEFRETLSARLHILVNAWLAPEYLRTDPLPGCPDGTSRNGKAMGDKLPLFLDKINTPLGELQLLADEAGNLRAIDWTDHEERMRLLLSRQYRSTQIIMERSHDPFGLASALEAYFAGDLERIESLPVATGGTPFQRNVWKSLRSIPAGETTSY